jgi:hypothetical protein
MFSRVEVCLQAPHVGPDWSSRFRLGQGWGSGGAIREIGNHRAIWRMTLHSPFFHLVTPCRRTWTDMSFTIEERSGNGLMCVYAVNTVLRLFLSRNLTPKATADEAPPNWPVLATLQLRCSPPKWHIQRGKPGQPGYGESAAHNQAPTATRYFKLPV